MNSNSTLFAAAALALGVNLAPCQTAGNLGTPQEPMLDFTVVGAAESAKESGPQIEAAEAGGLEVTGAIATPNPCYEVSASLSAEGNTLTLTLTATAKGGFCPQMVAAFDYRARITQLDSGTYELVTVHRYPETGWKEKRFQLQVEVP